MCEPRRFKLTLAYDGTAYKGWQIQLDEITVQQTLEECLAGIVKHPVQVYGSGRTDRGVHARAQVAHVDLTTRMHVEAMQRALNARLPHDLRIIRVQLVPSTFHAQLTARGKEYRYFVWNDALVPPHKRLYWTHAYRPLDLDAMRAGAAHFIGEHDFSAFTANPQRDVFTTVRTIFDFKVTQHGKEFVFSVKGGGFLYKQVRSMVGFLLRVGEGRETPAAVAELLKAAPTRTARVPTALPQGLFLWRVWYR